MPTGKLQNGGDDEQEGVTHSLGSPGGANYAHDNIQSGEAKHEQAGICDYNESQELVFWMFVQPDNRNAYGNNDSHYSHKTGQYPLSYGPEVGPILSTGEELHA